LLLVLLLCAGFLVAVPVTRVIARGFSRPLEQLTRKAEAISLGDYDQPLPVHGEDELGQLASSVNAMSRAIAEREQEITRSAYYDVLTGLPNRQMITLLGEQALTLAEREQRALAVVALDIERFQAINDALGYHSGDLLLCAVGERLREVLREADAVSRPGGNEFLALLHTHEMLNIASLHRRIELAFDAPVEIEGHPVDVALAMGVAMYPDHGADIQTLMRNAEIALTAAKRDRLGLVVYASVLDETRLSHLTLLSDLKRAVERDELVMHLQPKVDVFTGAVTSAEALVRWQHPERGFVPPGEFIPFAEQSGRIGMLTHWMLGKAMQLTTQWAKNGRPVQISVNVSSRDVLDERFPAALEALLVRHQGLPQWIRLEITESGVMEDAERALRVLHQIRDLGFSLSIDDFGTGYSSLSYLKKMPVAELKIDRSFIHGARAGTDAATLLRSTIDLGHNLALSVVAEGVETPEEWALLRDLGCDYIQGFLASRALPVDEFLRWVAATSPFLPLDEPVA
ncbi:MAG: EAL domain-containing protein, partial [Moraxellaceae bacterium]|nr:EAL domain-containing protein [Moraxellaceae bacterium]